MIAVKKAAIAGLALGAVALAGCAPQGKNNASQPVDTLTQLKSNPSASLQTAASTMSAAKSMSVTMTGKMMNEPLSARGAIQLGSPPKADLTMSVDGKDTKVLLVGTAEYMQLPAGETASLGGKKWLKVDLADAAKAAGMNAAQVTDQFNNLDPGKQIKAMLASNQLKAAGEDTVDGVKTVHYTGDINLEQYLDAYSTPAGRATIKAGLVKAGLKSIKTDLWVDEKYQVRKASVVSGPMDVTCTYADYGKPVNVVAPPAGETADMMELLKGLGKTPA